jgi:hypothetical protein
MDPKVTTEIRNQVDQVLVRLARVPEQPPGLGWDPQDLNGACAVASWLLFRALRDQGVEADFCISADEGHCFCMVGDFVVDPTARQFGFCPDVVVAETQYLTQRYRQGDEEFPWALGRRVSTEPEIQEILADWTPDQQPRYYQDKGIL